MSLSSKSFSLPEISIIEYKNCRPAVADLGNGYEEVTHKELLLIKKMNELTNIVNQLISAL